jgi:hypothetical protein
MLRVLADENFHGAIVRGILRASPSLDLITVADAGLLGMSDPQLLAWAAERGRLLLTHDVRTIPTHVQARLTSGLPMPGVVEVPALCSIRQVIEDIVLLCECSLDGEWEGQIVRVPM